MFCHNCGSETAENAQFCVKCGAPQQIETSFPEDMLLVRADAKLADQALANVVCNAVSHTSGDSRIVVGADVSERTIALHVTDDGPGIPSQILPHAFEKFVRARSLESGRADGGEVTGLGLAIAKGIMEAHGGSITANSPVAHDRGTSVVLTFPREEVPS